MCCKPKISSGVQCIRDCAKIICARYKCSWHGGQRCCPSADTVDSQRGVDHAVTNSGIVRSNYVIEQKGLTIPAKLHDYLDYGRRLAVDIPIESLIHHGGWFSGVLAMLE